MWRRSTTSRDTNVVSVETTLRIDLLDPASFVGGQPHDQFRWLREHDPVYRHAKPEGGSFWALTRYADVRAVGRDHQTFSGHRGRAPSYVIADMLGIPLDDGRRLYVLTEKMHSANVPQEEAAAAVMEMLLYAADVRQRKLREPADDIATALVHAQVKDHGELGAEEFNWFFLLLINAGGDTTRNAVGGGMLALFEHGAELARLQTDLDTYVPTAVEEILRWCSPVAYMRRTALKDCTVGDVPIEEGDALALYYGAANRDPAMFSDPEHFDVAREPNEHIAFGGGVHFCLGVHIARVEIQVMLRELLTRLPDIEPSGEPTWLDSNFISGPQHLPVRFTPAGTR